MRDKNEELVGSDYTFSELKALLEIDPLDLDTELMRQPWLFGVVADALVSFQDERDMLKDELDRLESEVGLDIRKEYDDEGISYTEGKVKSEVMTDPEVVKLRARLQDKKSMVARIASLKEAYETRSRMLGHLARLYVSEYFGSNPSVSTDVRSEAGTLASRKKATSTRKPLRHKSIKRSKTHR